MSKRPSCYRLLIVAPLLLVAAVGVQVYARLAYPAHSSLESRTLANLLPGSSARWKAQDLPIAQSEAAVGNVENILRYDDVFFRRYTRGALSVDVYVAYWTPGKMSYWDVGTHNPDSCWVFNGFVCAERRHAVQWQDAALPLKPFEYGRYTHTGTQIDVLFWHLVGGVPNRYEEQKEGWRNGLAGRIERFPLLVKDVKTYGLDMHREQFFVRVSANQPLLPLLADPDFQELLRGLAPTGILR